MTTYNIYNRDSAAYLGTYEADSPEAAIDAMCRDAGYRDHHDAAAALGQMPQAFRADFLPTTPIEVNADGTIIDGHARVAALRMIDEVGEFNAEHFEALFKARDAKGGT